MESYQLEMLKARELEIVKEFHRVCEKNCLRYTLAFGTTIGCVRHKGFIPWDDDIDVTMPYEDYIKFNEIAQTGLDGKYILVNHEKEKYYRIPFAKLQIRKSCAISRYPSPYKWKNQGIYIDIFPAFYVPKNPIKRKLLNTKISLLGVINSCYSFDRVKHTHKGLLGNMLLFGAFIINKMLPYQYVIESMYKSTATITTDESNEMYVCNFNVSNIMNRYKMKKNAFDNRILMTFEDTELWMPRDYDAIMKNYYGDYMKLPDESKRDTHGFKVVSDTQSYCEYGKYE